MALLDEFKTRFANDERLDLVVIEADWSSLNPQWKCYYGCEFGDNDCGDEAIFNLIAHLWISESSTKATPMKGVDSKSVGSVSVSFSASSDNSERALFFNTSIYGQRFLRITSTRIGGRFV